MVRSVRRATGPEALAAAASTAPSRRGRRCRAMPKFEPRMPKSTKRSKAFARVVKSLMTDTSNPFAAFDLKQAIDLRWALRDIRGKRTKLSPIDRHQLETLIEMGLVEISDDQPVLTNSGNDVVV